MNVDIHRVQSISISKIQNADGQDAHYIDIHVKSKTWDEAQTHDRITLYVDPDTKIVSDLEAS